MRKVVLLFSVVLSVLFYSVSCEGELPFILTRSNFEPVDSVLKSEPVTEGNRGYFALSWEEDKGADSYIVMRAEDAENLTFEKIYEGRELSFEDTEFESNTAYVYRLDKVRGDRVFEGSRYAYGFYCGGVPYYMSEDIYEDNDCKERAKIMDGTIEANLYAVKFNTNSKLLYDEDWYYMTVPAGYTATIKLNQSYRSIESGDTDLKIYIDTKTGVGMTVNQNGIYSLKNTTNTMQDIYFRIIADTQTLFGEVSSGFVVIDYRIELDNISQ